ncbi:hypothetical protein [Magnetospirillum sp. UT-4]|uniref:hypothetical protein n=1 Tax=Magnetospirillum sp. UT-4 TaxID=2681467 RepID=UPI001385C279|nr:hypothetical protein [Magnetospirillum sp. UT-4]CAA7624409.1 conserved exported hypothetical protein [Magnetospirillum sp. UT-4]
MTPARRAAFVALVLLPLAGCGTSTALPPVQSGDPGQAPDFTLLTDIPIPSGATMDNDRSLVLGDRDRWTGRVVMKLWKSAPEATAFYQSQMPNFGWEPVMAVTSGISVMSYTRGDRAATVQVESGSMWGAKVSVTVAPRHTGPGSMPAAAPMPAPTNIPVAAPVERVRSEPLPPSRR